MGLPASPPTPAEWVAPGPDTLAAALSELDLRLEQAEALAAAAARWQNRRTPGDRTCDAGAAPYFAFADAWRVAAQRARVQADRVEWLWQAPTLAAVRTDDLARHVDASKARAHGQGEAWGVFSTWHDRYGPRCATVPPLAAISPGGAPATGRTAVWVVSGVLCPGADAAPGPKVLTMGMACVAAEVGCACVPGPLVPGAVLAAP